MVQIRVDWLKDVPLRTIHRTFLKAFADYQVKLDLPLHKFEMMARRRGYRPKLSVGAFERDELVGFVLNGIRDWQGHLTAYDTGTGVVPEHRGRGVTKAMFREVLEDLRKAKVELYLLEVIKENTPAVTLYKKQGFTVTRGFSCYAAVKQRLRPGVGCDVEVKDIPVRGLDRNTISQLWDFVPSWQNSPDSVFKASADLHAVGAYNDTAELVGYGIIEPSTGDIPQLAVRWDYRDQGVGRCIMDGLVEQAESDRILAVNIEETKKGPRGFLEHLGFKLFTEQYEMVLDIAQ
jgi:ribosomal protein S18 acetylase RimI-like enzyme